MKLTTSQLLSGALIVGAAGASAYVALAPGAALPPSGNTPPQAAPAERPARRAARPDAERPRPASPPASRGVEVVFQAPWGSGPGQLGRALLEEASAEGPMSFAVDRDGRALVLDQVNARVAVFARGEQPKSFALPTDTYQDIAVDPNGGVVALDRLVSRAVAFFTPDGEIRHQVPLEGPGVDDGGQVTALFAREDGAWVEVDHGPLVRVALADGSPDPARAVAPGRPTARDGVFVRAALAGERTAEVAEVTAGGAFSPFARAELAASVLQLNALEVDKKGRVFLGASLYAEEPDPPYASAPLGDQIIVFAPGGAEIGRVLFPSNSGPEEQLVQARLGGDGALYHLGLSDEGATMRRYVP